MEDHRLIEMEEDTAVQVDEEEDNMEEEDEEDEDGDYEDNDGEEVEELIPSETTISSSIADGLVNDSNVDDENPVSQENVGDDRGEIDVCPICFQVWTNCGDHRICCLPCGHIYGMSCIKRWLVRCQSNGKCPQCKSLCTLKDIIVLYTTHLCVAEDKSCKTSVTDFSNNKEGFIEFQQYISSRMDVCQQRMDALERRAEECDSQLRFLQRRFFEVMGETQENDQ